MRHIAVVTTSRADYGHLYWPLQELQRHRKIKLSLIVMGAHLAPEFGATVTEIEGDGFEIAARIECLLSSDSDAGMAKTIGVATLSFADALAQMRPDLLLLIADRYELLAPASVALALRIPIAHIEGGDISEGAIDDAVRNALTKMAHLHFTPTQAARRRVIAMGEEPWRVHFSGAPSLDHLRRSQLFDCDQLRDQLGLDLTRPTAVVAYHPVTLDRETTQEADAFFAALEHLHDIQIVFCFPNADAGSRGLVTRAHEFCDVREHAHLFVNLNHLTYWSLLRCAAFLIGNSSSGIMETASLGLPTVNIGRRQQGRQRPRNVIDAAADRDEILASVRLALDPSFRESLKDMRNPYGDGHAGETIAQVILDTPFDDRLLHKKALPLDDHGAFSEENP